MARCSMAHNTGAALAHYNGALHSRTVKARIDRVNDRTDRQVTACEPLPYAVVHHLSSADPDSTAVPTPCALQHASKPLFRRRVVTLY